MTLNRRTFLTGAGAGLLLAGCDVHADQAAKGPLPVLPLSDLTGLDPDMIPLRLAASTHDFGTGEPSKTFGINADYLGPVLRVKSGQTLPFAVENALDELASEFAQHAELDKLLTLAEVPGWRPE